MKNHTIVEPRVYTAAPERLPTEDTPAVLPLGPAVASRGPRHGLVRWVAACEALDRDEAGRLARELRRRFGISVRKVAERGGRA